MSSWKSPFLNLQIFVFIANVSVAFAADKDPDASEVCKRAFSLIVGPDAHPSKAGILGALAKIGVSEATVNEFFGPSVDKMGATELADRFYAFFMDPKQTGSHSKDLRFQETQSFFRSFQKSHGRDALWSRIPLYVLHLAEGGHNSVRGGGNVREDIEHAKDMVRISLIGREVVTGGKGWVSVFSPVGSSDPAVTRDQAIEAMNLLVSESQLLRSGQVADTYFFNQQIRDELYGVIMKEIEAVREDHRRDPAEKMEEIEQLEAFRNWLVWQAADDSVGPNGPEVARSKAFDPVRGLPNMIHMGTFGPASSVMAPKDLGFEPIEAPSGHNFPNWEKP